MERKSAKAPAGPKKPSRATGKSGENVKPKIGRPRKYDAASSRRIPAQVNPDAPLGFTPVINDRRPKMAKIDFSGVGNGFEPMDSSSEEVTVTKAEIKNSKPPKTTQYVNVELTVNEGSPNQGRKLWTIWGLTPESLWKMKQDCIKLGLDPELFAGEADLEEDILPQVIGQQAIAEIKITEYDGKKKNEVVELKELTYSRV